MMECDIAIDPEYVIMRIHSSQFKLDESKESNKKISELINQVMTLMDLGFKICNSEIIKTRLTICINISHLHEDMEGEYLEKDIIQNRIYSKENCKKVIEYIEKGYHLSVKKDCELNFATPIKNIYFGENSIKIGDIVIENLIIENLHIEITKKTYKNYNIENLNEIRIHSFSLHLPKLEVCKFIEQYIGYAYGLINFIDRTPADLTKISAESGSMFGNIFNPNSEWRKNLFILISIIMFQNKNESQNESEFRSDLLANPAALIKLAGYQTDFCETKKFE